MQNHLLNLNVVRDIDVRVGKLLDDLGRPDPPLDSSMLREQFRLDQRYYSSSDTGVLRRLAHRLKVGGKQLLARPTLLVDVVKKFGIRGLWMADSREILIDQELPPVKQRWVEVHEIVHSMLPWHGAVLLGDTNHTVSLSCHSEIEAEANYGCGRILFLQDRFIEELPSYQSLCFNDLRNRQKQFKNSLTSTLWRAVESLDVPAFGMVSDHPFRPRVSANLDDGPIRYFIRSRPFEAKYRTSANAIWRYLPNFCKDARGGLLGECRARLDDTNGDHQVFRLETFFNQHDALTLGIWDKAQKPMIATK